MSKIRVRLLGGFEVWDGDRQVAGFESQKVRALLAYLACHRHRAFSRDHLAGLLWPERETDGARHALRQAVYNLRAKLPAGEVLLSSHQEIGLHPQADCWVDVEEFEEALRQGADRSVDPHLLSTAVQLYRGEFLASFFVKDSPDFEDWMLGEQVRLRDAAVDVLRRLIESYRRRGEYRFGVHYARRLVALEPLSEEAHRELMQLCALAGQRSRALAHYEELLKVLRDELGVEPLAETRRLYESILSEAAKGGPAVDTEAEPIGPIIPLVGRAAAYAHLREGWARALAGSVELTLVAGERGIGKTRLIKSFLDSTTSNRRCIVLKGRCYEQSPLVPYQLFLEVLRGALAEEVEAVEEVLAPVAVEVLEDLVRLVPELRDLRPDLPAPGPLTLPEERRRLFASVGLFLEELGRRGDPVILFLDDLHLADRDTLDLLVFLFSKLEGAIWIVAACRSEEMDWEHPLNQIVRRGEKEGRATRLEVDRLELPALDEIAESLVGEPQADELAAFLEERSAGLPLAVTELVNFLWDEGILAARDPGRWSLPRSLRELDLPEDLDELILLRIRRLPNSTRRLASLAAIFGQTFDVQLLQEAADEHAMVVEIGIDVLLKRWLIRQFAHVWTDSQREEDLTPWKHGGRAARRGSFEFAHNRIRKAIYAELNPLRRQAMHLQAAAALESLQGGRPCEALAFHYAAGGQWEKALPYLERAADRALAVRAGDAARRYCDQALEVLSRLAAGARSEAAAERWREERETIRAKAAALSGSAASS